MAQVSRRLVWLIENLDVKEATGDAGARWDIFQCQELLCDAQFSITNKSRQIGWSWICAIAAVADMCLTKRSTTIFVSLNQEEAAEKIRYARYAIAALDRPARPKLIIDNRLELESSTGSRIISHPCLPVRGKGRSTVILDEFAHYPKDKEIYASVLPVTTRGGRIVIGSTPLGAQGMFWEIMEQKLRGYPGYRRRSFPWWTSLALCPKTPDGIETLETEERVMKHGTERIVSIFQNLPLTDFQQEYECGWMDEQEAWISWGVIRKNQELAAEDKLEVWMAGSAEGAIAAIDHLAETARAGKVEGVFGGGMDIGRKKDLTEIILLGKATTGAFPYRLGISLSGVKFDEQRRVVKYLLDRLHVVSFYVDATGLGMQLGEQLHDEYGIRVVPCPFTAESKELWAVDLKVAMERGRLPIPIDKELSYQIHSIKRKTSESKHAIFDVGASEKHHADKFWALALAVSSVTRELPIATVARMEG